MTNNLKESKSFLFFASPWLAGFFLLTIVPLVSSLALSLTKWDILTPPEFIGLTNYVEIFQDPLFFKSLKVTISFALFSVPLSVLLGIMISILLNANIPGIKIFRTIYYLPVVLSGAVVSLLWAWILNPEFGLANAFLGVLGIEGPRWIYDESWVLPSLVIMSLWGVGSSVIIYLSGLQGIPTEQYEAARLDGAGFFQRLIYVTLPNLSPIILFTVITGMIAALQTFTQAYVMTSGGPNHASLFYAYYVYSHAFTWRKMGKACALAWLLFILIFGLSMMVFRFSRKFVYYESDTGGSL